MSIKHVLSMIEEHQVKFIDLRFTDTKGKEQHITIVYDKNHKKLRTHITVIFLNSK